MLNALNGSHCLDRNQPIHAQSAWYLACEQHKQWAEGKSFAALTNRRGRKGNFQIKIWIEKMEKVLWKHSHLFHGFLEQTKPPCTQLIVGVRTHGLTLSQERHHSLVARKGYFSSSRSSPFGSSGPEMEHLLPARTTWEFVKTWGLLWCTSTPRAAPRAAKGSKATSPTHRVLWHFYFQIPAHSLVL